MQSQNLTELMKDAFTNPFDKESVVKPKMEKLAEKNKMDIGVRAGNMVDVRRVPTADELIEMRQWAINYKKANRHDSKRQIRKAIQEHFNIRIFR